MGGIKKLSLIVARTDFVDLLSELIDMACFEPFEPQVALDPPELSELINREVTDLAPFGTNYDSIVLLATQYTCTLTGWVQAGSEQKLAATFSRFVCAWDILDLTPFETDYAPIVLKYPQFFGKMRCGGRRLFAPLSRGGG